MILARSSIGSVASTECSGAASRCGIERQCRVGGGWQRVNAAIRRALDDVTLRELAGLETTEFRLVPLSAEARAGLHHS